MAMASTAPRTEPVCFDRMTSDVRAGDSDPEFFAGIQLASHFKPVFSLTHRRLVGHEALVRGAPTDGGQSVSPKELFGRCANVAQASCLDRAARRQHLEAYRHADQTRWLFLNALPSAIAERGHWSADVTARDLEHHGLRPDRVVVEVVEDSLPSDACFEGGIEELRALGCLIALGDFGSGQSNFDRVFRLRPEIVKLHRSVVSRAVADAHARRVVSRMVSLLHECGCLVLMDGIESAEGAYAALRCGVDLVQGHHFGRPSPALVHDDVGIELIRAAWGLYDRLWSDQRTAWHELTAPYRQAIVAASASLAAGCELPAACAQFMKLAGAQECFVLDSAGRELVKSVLAPGLTEESAAGSRRFSPLHDNRDARWSRRPYFQQAIDNPSIAVVTRPYLSLRGGPMRVTVSKQFERDGSLLIVCGDAEVSNRWDVG